jgi:hypothetical protein
MKPCKSVSSLALFKEIFMQNTIHVNVFEIPATREKTSEMNSQEAYEAIDQLLYAHRDLCLSAYRLYNQSEASWILILINIQTISPPYQAHIDHILSKAHAQPRTVPSYILAPFVEHFLVRQTQMQINQTPYFEKHYPLPKKHKKMRKQKKKKKW